MRFSLFLFHLQQQQQQQLMKIAHDQISHVSRVRARVCTPCMRIAMGHRGGFPLQIQCTWEFIMFYLSLNRQFILKIGVGCTHTLPRMMYTVHKAFLLQHSMRRFSSRPHDECEFYGKTKCTDLFRVQSRKIQIKLIPSFRMHDKKGVATGIVCIVAIATHSRCACEMIISTRF